MKTKIKICGLRTQEDIQIVNREKPDYAGFVFAPGKRQIDISQAKILKSFLEPEITAVGVFVNAPFEEVCAIADKNILDWIQLHGDEDETYIRHLRELTDKPVIKAIRVRNTKDIRKGDHLPCDYLLLDAYQKEQYGGSGHTFDWSMIPKMTKPFFLAGGISERNLEEAIQTYQPFALDVSSSVETAGKKDADKVKRIIELVRNRKEEEHE